MVILTAMVKKPIPPESQSTNPTPQSEVKDEEILVIVPPQPWEKQIGESDRAFSAFVVYRDLPPNLRTYKAVVEQLYPNAPWAVQKVTDWAKKYSWEYRAGEWQKELDRVRREAQLSTIEEMIVRQREAGMVMSKIGLRALQAKSAKEIAEMSPSDLRLLITEGFKLEKESRGIKSGKATEEPNGDESPESKSAGPASISGASDDELERLDQAAQKHLTGKGEETPS